MNPLEAPEECVRLAVELESRMACAGIRPPWELMGVRSRAGRGSGLASSLGAPVNGRLLEVMWSEALRRDLAEWIEHDAQLPATTAVDFGSAMRLSGALSTRRICVADALCRLGAILERHAVKPVEELPRLLESGKEAHAPR